MPICYECMLLWLLLFCLRIYSAGRIMFLCHSSILFLYLWCRFYGMQTFYFLGQRWTDKVLGLIGQDIMASSWEEGGSCYPHRKFWQIVRNSSFCRKISSNLELKMPILGKFRCRIDILSTRNLLCQKVATFYPATALTHGVAVEVPSWPDVCHQLPEHTELVTVCWVLTAYLLRYYS